MSLQSCLYIIIIMLTTANIPPPPHQLEQRLVAPPHRPRLEGDRDLANFPPEYTDEPIQLTPDVQ